MTDNPQKSTQGRSKDGLALVIGGLFILALVFAAYNYFNRPKNEETVRLDETEIVADEGGGLLERIRKTLEGSGEGDLNGDGAMDIKDDRDSGDGDVAGETMEQGQRSGYDKESYESMWIANDYDQGDISGNSHTVVRGDTLWEIAEAVYGNGAEWTRILEANSSSIGYLPSGQQALIVPGQVLVLP